MKRLTARIVLQLAAAIVVELVVINLAFLVWLQHHLAADVRHGVARTELADVIATERLALLVLLAAGALAVGLGTFFLRRSLLRPLRRLTELVHLRELAGLDDFAARTKGDDLARLGRAIVAMKQAEREDQRRIESQLTELVQKNQELMRAARLAMVGQLAAGLAHEVGNPLSVLAGYVDMLKSGELSAPEREMAIERMRKELDRITVTLRQLLDFSRTKTVSDEGGGDVAAAIDHLRGLVGPQLGAIEWVVDVPRELPKVALGTDAIIQVLLNLMMNAIAAVTGTGRIELRCEAQDRVVVLSVDDSGEGVAPGARAHVFEPFFTTKPAGEGTGLGLAVCERLVTEALGTIELRESPLGGARFVVTLPWAA